MFLGRFRFTITYHPGSWNTKPGALSRQFSSEEREPYKETIRNPECVLRSNGQLRQKFRKLSRTRRAQMDACRDGCLSYSPNALMGAHLPDGLPSRSPGSHPAALLAAIHGCGNPNFCRCTPPSGLLQPLPIPPRPWSHIALDFVTGLPPSEVNDTVLRVVDHFSKAVHFVSLPKLPTTLETANLLVQHVFRLHGVPQDILSDHGRQFTSQVWKAFCRALGTTSSFTLGHHPQSNGQTERANQSLESSLRCVAFPSPGPHTYPG